MTAEAAAQAPAAAHAFLQAMQGAVALSQLLLQQAHLQQEEGSAAAECPPATGEGISCCSMPTCNRRDQLLQHGDLQQAHLKHEGSAAAAGTPTIGGTTCYSRHTCSRRRDHLLQQVHLQQEEGSAAAAGTPVTGGWISCCCRHTCSRNPCNRRRDFSAREPPSEEAFQCLLCSHTCHRRVQRQQ